MSIESEILKSLLVGKDYTRYRANIELHALSTPGRMVLETIDQLRKSDDNLIDIVSSDLRLSGIVLNPNWSEEDQAIFLGGLDKLEAASEGEANNLFKTWIEREVAAAIADKADQFIESPTKFKQGFFKELEESYLKLKLDLSRFDTSDDSEDFDTNIERLLASLRVNGLWNWRLKCLNSALGPIYPGQLVVLGGRPEAGKTTLVCSEAAHLASQMPEDSVLAFFNNESIGKVLRMRFISSVIGWQTRNIERDIARAQGLYDKAMNGRQVLIKDVHGGTIGDVDRVLEKYQDRVKLIVFDQAGKLNGYEEKSGNSATRLQRLAAHLKTMAAQIAPVITTWWADGTAEGEKYIEQNQLNDSKTGVPGEAEVIVTLGHTKQPEDKGIRYINIPKNKSMACPDETVRHSKWMVRLEGPIARVTD